MEIIPAETPKKLSVFCQKFHKQTLGFELIITENFEEISQFWQQISPNNNIFLQNDFMRVCMQTPLHNTGQVFGVFLKDSRSSSCQPFSVWSANPMPRNRSCLSSDSSSS